MKKEKINNLKNSSKLLIIVSGIMLFLLVIFISYSIFGNGKGTYSAEVCGYTIPGTIEYDCPSGTHSVGSGVCCPSGYSFDGNQCHFRDAGSYPSFTPSDHYVDVTPTTASCSISGYSSNIISHNGKEYCCPSSDYKVVDIYFTTTDVVVPSCVPKNVTCSNASSGSDSSDDSNEVTISFHSNNGVWSDQSGSPVKTVKCTIESGKSKCSPKSLPSGTVSKSGFDFKGWGEKGNCESGFTSASAVVVDKDITFYACWKKIENNGSTEITMSFHSNGGIWSDQTGDVKTKKCTIKSGESKCAPDSLPSGTVSKSGHDFKGWGTSTGCTSGFTSASDAVAGKNITFYACWKDSGSSSGGSSGGTTTSCTYQITKPSGASYANGYNGFEIEYSGEVYLNKDSSSSTGNGGLRKYVIPPTGKCFTDNWTVTFANGSTKTYSQYISSTASNGTSGDCGITLTPNFTTCSSGSGDDTPTSCKVTLDANGGSFTNVNGCGSTYTYKDKIYFSSTLNSCVKNGDKCVTGWKVIDGNNKGKTYTSSIDQTDCGSKLQAQWGSCSGSGSGTGTTDAVYSEKINEDRCSNGKWVRVASCQPTSVKDAKCKLSDDTIVDRSTIMNSRSGCEILGNAYENVINDYRCNMVTGKWIYITSCQARSVIGAHCKYASGNVIRTDLSDGAYCSDPKPSTGSNDKTQQDVDRSAPTGTLEVVIAWAIGIIALFVSFYYFKKNKTVNN